MTRRVLSAWLPRLATDRIARARPAKARPAKARPECAAAPLAAILEARNRLTVAAVNDAAAAAGVAPGQTVAHARALCSGLAVARADPAGDLRTLDRLAGWCGRYTPWAAVDVSGGLEAPLVNGAGLWLDISGCAHLFGGEAALIAELAARLGGFGFRARLAVADTPGAAWAWARFGDAAARPVLPPGGQAEALAPLPVAALRLAPAEAESLDRLGLRRIGDLAAVPRAALAARFGAGVRNRLDQALGVRREPISPRRQVAPLLVRLAFAEPVGRPEDLAAGLDRLLATLCARLEAEGLGARRLRYTLYRIDGSTAAAAVGVSRPSRAPGHLAGLFAPRLERLDPEPGVELLTLDAPVAEPLAPAQAGLPGAHPSRRASGPPQDEVSYLKQRLRPEEAQSAVSKDAPDQNTGQEVAQLVDRLVNRLGAERVLRLVPHQDPLPERRAAAVGALESGAANRDTPWGDRSDRRRTPPRLLPRPEPVEGRRAGTDRPPATFTWRGARHRVVRADGPEHLTGAWWRPAAAAADRAYHRVEDQDGRRLWLFRDRATGRWYVHGLFG